MNFDKTMSHGIPPFSFSRLMRDLDASKHRSQRTSLLSSTSKSQRKRDSKVNRHLDFQPRYVPYNKDPRLLKQEKHPFWKMAHPSKKRDNNCISKSFEYGLGKEMMEFLDFAQPSPKEQRLRNETIQRIQKQIWKSFPERKVFVFGSTASGICFPHSDIDLGLKDPHVSGESLTAGHRSSKLSKMAKKLYPLCSKLYIIRRARVPIIKLTDSKSGLEVDIGYDSPNMEKSVVTTLDLIQRHQSTKPIIMIIKIFLENRDLNSVYNGGLGGLSITLMVSYFLNVHSKLYSERYTQSNEFQLLGSQLIDFFHFWGTIFNYRELGFNSQGLIVKINKLHPTLSQSRTLVLVDPHDKNNNIAAGSHKIQSVLSAFSDAYTTLTKKSTNYRRGTSILSSLICISKQFEETRERFGRLTEDSDSIHRTS